MSEGAIRADGRKTVIVTGSSKGIGLGIAAELARQGMAVVVTSRKQADADEAAAKIIEAGGVCAAIQFDLEKADDIQPLIQGCLEIFGRLDVLVNNALSQKSVLPLPACDYSMIEAAFTANITNTLALTQAAHPHLKQTGGVVINIGSIIINRHLLGLPLYAIIKGAIAQMTKALAAEWAADSVRVNCINPGFIRTSAFSDLGMTAEQIEQAYDFYKRYIPQHRIGSPEAVAKLVAYLVSEEANLITGASFDIDGGYSVQGVPLFGSSCPP